MNKKFVEYFTQNGFNYDNNCFCGKLKGFQVSGVCVSNTVNLTFYVNVNESESQQIYDWFTQSKRTYGITAVTVDQMSVNCTINALLNPTQKCIELIANGVDFLSTFKQPDCCPFCGLPLEEHAGEEAANTFGEIQNITPPPASRLVGIGSNRLYAHEKCFDDYAEAIANQEVAASSAPNNYLRGTLGAVLGCLLGCVLWALLYLIGYIAVIAAIVVSLVAAFLWDKLGGKNNKVKIVAVWVISIVMISIVMFIMYMIDVQIAMNNTGLEGNVFEIFFELLDFSPEYKNAIMIDTIISYIFIIVGNIYTTFQILKTQKLTSTTLIKL